jgi:hypothetical protein
MRYPILLSSSSSVGSANRYSEKYFHRVGQGRLGMSLRNQGGGAPKTFENHWFQERTLILNIEMFKKPSGPDDASGEWRVT